LYPKPYIGIAGKEGFSKPTEQIIRICKISQVIILSAHALIKANS